MYTSDLIHATNGMHLLAVHLESFAMDNGGAQLVIFLLTDPHLLEGAQQGQDEAPNSH